MPTASKTRSKSQELFERAQTLMPGGVNSPVRAFKSIGTHPVFVKRAQGAYLWDEDDNRYIDYVASWGPMILGHADADIQAALEKTLIDGTSFGAPTALENEMAAEVIKLVPSIEVVRMVNSGTEAVMSALRLARAYTKRNIIIKFTGCYHGHADSMLVQAGSGVATLGLPNSPGVTESASKDTVLLPYNNKEAVQEVFGKLGEQIAGIILEPVVGNSGCILPQKGYLEFLRDITSMHGALLIFDEVMTGFRVALGGAQEYFNIKPDITTLGKVIGGGLPVGAYGASREIMSMVAPDGPMYQAGTLSGNPLAMAAGLTCLRKIQAPGFYQKLSDKVSYLIAGLKKVSGDRDIQFTQAGAMFGMAFSPEPIHSYEDTDKMDLEFFAQYYRAMLEQGVYLAPSAYEAGFVSAAHTQQDLDKTIEIHSTVLNLLQ